MSARLQRKDSVSGAGPAHHRLQAGHLLVELLDRVLLVVGLLLAEAREPCTTGRLPHRGSSDDLFPAGGMDVLDLKLTLLPILGHARPVALNACGGASDMGAAYLS